jgi:Cu(I)/Ag(I) efflux system membrane protein CusA/SilA
MIAGLIRWSIRNRLLVLLATLLLAAWGVHSVRQTPLDALPDLSDTQVIIKASYPGKAPQVVEDQVTYPLTTTLLGVPGAKTVRAYSSFGDAFVYVLFDDKTDLYWARSRVLEYLNQVQSRLPRGATVSLGPDATGVGWVYEYALVDRTGQQDLGQLRALNDWFLKFELKTVPDVSEVASVGGMVRQYQVVLDPDKLRAYSLSQSMIANALDKANQEAGGSVVEMGEAEYMVRSSGYLRSLDDFRNVVLRSNDAGTPVLLGDVARIQIGPEMRRGIAELNGEGEVAGGIIVMRSGKNALTTIEAVKAKLADLQRSLPTGVEVVTTYDRSQLIQRAVSNLTGRLIEEFIIVGLVCAVFLFHLRSALVAVISLPLGVLAAFIVMRYQGVNANLMSLGGIAIAIGAMVDAAIVMIENAHKHLEAYGHAHPGVRSGSRASAVFFFADHHAFVHPGVFAPRPGGQALLTLGLHQDLHDRGSGWPISDAGTRFDGLPDPRSNSARKRQPTQPRHGADVSPAVGSHLAPPLDRFRMRSDRAGHHCDSPLATGRRISAAFG